MVEDNSIYDFPVVEWIRKTLTNDTKRVFLKSENDQISYSELLKEIEEKNEFIKSRNLTYDSIYLVLDDNKHTSIAELIALLANGYTVCPLKSQTLEKHLLLLNQIAKIDSISKATDSIIKKLSKNKTLIDSSSSLLRQNIVFFTSGTSGTPKAVFHSASPLIEKFFAKKVKPENAIRFLGFDHMGGINTILALLHNGSTFIALESFTVDKVCKAIQDFSVSFLPTTPTFLTMLYLSKAWEKFDLSSLKLISYGAEIMNEKVLISLNEKFPLVEFKQTYGLTELGVLSIKSKSSTSTWLKLNIPSGEFRIVDNILHLKVPSQANAIIEFSPIVTLNDKVKTEWFNTQDMVEQEEDFIRFLGRNTDIINVAGQKVYPEEIRQKLETLSIVKNCHIFGEKNIITGNTVIARITVDNSISEESAKLEILTFCREKLLKFQIPSRIEISHNLLMNERFKLQR